ncbi:ATP--guanido phosphotransferase [Leptospira sp. 2 VSF19]|uniref:ATP--guanido phosphotransferase n=1 Tax=Leptospira soteropolitanensis TaxID=2950025 RepID=A0AAW5VMT0_9LEPT|nr:ATP--guanido phosphotransferase [Leptospira soteropolitanensis]MCW7493351.1 ATP--guanido phosphotransferase [Leptospira soteropolitanensis]MCW7501117.1 ATP--guanido phosphotransferase [Leptospira soteropolitanensis]MCW7523203.1 ATP--guanido phosphotransferase [Leptospira soteropolitanensis]MCW7527064.1 ATP--guanido phosphotransferase [Leptospira soteropolitanensis]MCW7530921.1 ATP--guanido phosphotransferase [Leptospira soteropolitanensis]
MVFCRFCGTKEIQFRKSGKFGCGYCVQVFEYPKFTKTQIIPKNRIDVLEKFVKENSRFLTILSFRTRITRNIKSNRFPFYDSLFDKSKQLLVENEMEYWLYPNGLYPPNTLSENFEERMGFYLGSEDHIRWEKISFPYPLGGNDGSSLTEKKTKHKIFRFLLLKENWAEFAEIGYISSCPTNLGAGRRDSVLVSVDSVVSPKFFSILQTLTEFGIEFAPSSDHSFRKIGKNPVLVVKISWKNARAVQKRQFYKILGLRGSL